MRHLAEVFQAPDRGEPSGQVGDEQRAPRRTDVYDHFRALRPAPRREHLHGGGDHIVGHGGVRCVRGQDGPHPLAVAEVGEARNRPAGLGDVACDDLAADLDAEARHRRRPLPPRIERHAGPMQRGRGSRNGLLAGGGHEREPAAVVAAAAVARVRIVELLTQVAHPAGSGGQVGAHRLLFVTAHLRDLRVALGVVAPRLTGRDPAAADAAHRAVDVEHLQHRLEPRARQLDPRLQQGRTHRGAGVGAECAQCRADLILAGETDRREVVPDGLVFAAGQQDHLRAVDATAGAAHLLVVRDGGLRRAEVDHEAEVGFVEAHAERRRRDQRLDPVVDQVVLGGQALGLFGLAGVGGDGEATLAQVVGDLLGSRDGERVDDARAGQPVEMLGQPGEPMGGRGQRQHPEVQRFAIEAAAQDEHVVAVAAQTEDIGDIVDDPAVRGGGGCQHRDTGGQLGQQRAQPAEVRTEVVAPVADAVRFVDHQQATGRGELGQHVVAEVGVVQPLGRQQ